VRILMRLGLVVVLEWRSYAWLKADHATLAGSLAFMRANRGSLPSSRASSTTVLLWASI